MCCMFLCSTTDFVSQMRLVIATTQLDLALLPHLRLVCHYLHSSIRWSSLCESTICTVVALSVVIVVPFLLFPCWISHDLVALLQPQKKSSSFIPIGLSFASQSPRPLTITYLRKKMLTQMVYPSRRQQTTPFAEIDRGRCSLNVHAASSSTHISGKWCRWVSATQQEWWQCGVVCGGGRVCVWREGK